uniref:Uncharacterized protein n=1 Tax=Thermogemmatispora argillosa TaxID=2045280 RepID=A0A455T371_9CHLR|nr:hypothetical protein KTA_19300 [Thermogemmatispora argillosa]
MASGVQMSQSFFKFFAPSPLGLLIVAYQVMIPEQDVRPSQRLASIGFEQDGDHMRSGPRSQDRNLKHPAHLAAAPQ